MAHIRIRPNGRIQYDLHILGRRFREGTSMMATPKNMKIANATLKQMNAEIDLGSFEYRDYFPDSKKVALFESLRREKHPDCLYPFFDTYTNQWYERQLIKWSASYQGTMRNLLDKHLLPEFGNMLINEITLAHLEQFRNKLGKFRTEARNKPLSNRRINAIIGPLVTIISLAAEELKFDYPFRRYKALKNEIADSSPMSVDEVKRFLNAVDEFWKPYFVVRFHTGMRSCEINGLHWKHIDFVHRLIHIQQNYVNGQIGDVKTPKSRRQLQMTDDLYALFSELAKHAKADNPFVFTTPNGTPIDTHYLAKKVWYPTLKQAGLKRRRPYETRHTAAVLHIAAHENPLYISQMLGHSNGKLLFDVYAPYIANASRSDGNAFSKLMSGIH